MLVSPKGVIVYIRLCNTCIQLCISMQYMYTAMHIHAIHVYSYAYPCNTCIQLCISMQYMYTAMYIHAIHVYSNAYPCNTCIQLCISMQYMYTAMHIHAIHVYSYMYNSNGVRVKVRGWGRFCTGLMGNILVINCRSFANLAYNNYCEPVL